MNYLIQSAGLGGLSPNTVILAFPTGWKNDELKTKRFVSTL
jgi:hypothetical protein